MKKYAHFCVWIPEDKRQLEELKFYQVDISGKQMIIEPKQLLFKPFCSVSVEQACTLKGLLHVN